MRINGTGSTGATSKGKKSQSSQKTGGNFSALLSGASTGESQGTMSVGGTNQVEGIDALLALQEVGGEGNNNEKALKWGEEMLDQLDNVREALLQGRFSKQTLQTLSSLMKQKRGTFVDPVLQDILDDISMRVAIELAKYENVS